MTQQRATRQDMDWQGESFRAYDELPGSYIELADSCPDLSFDQTLDWYRILGAAIVSASDELCFAGVATRDRSRAAILLPLLLRRESVGPWRQRTAHSLANYYTAHFAPMIAPGIDVDEAAEALSDALLSIRPRWEWLDLNPVDDTSPFFRALTDRLRARRLGVETYFRFGNWYLEVAGRSFDEYYAGLPSKLKNTIKRKRRKLERESELDIRICTADHELGVAFADYWKIYDRSWKQAEPFPRFMEDIARCYAQKGWLRLGVASVDGVPAAAQIWFVKDDTASIFKLAYDPDFGKVSIGSILTQELMRHAIDVDNVATVDYLCGDDAYKQDWMSHRRERSGIRAYRLTMPMGLIGAARSKAVSLVRRRAES